MTPASTCPHCGAALSGSNRACPVCLLKLALEPLASLGDQDDDAANGSVAHPMRIGPYRILSVLGQGAMGVVYLAEQERPLHRTVALKVVKFGMDTREVVARFDSERQALALMSHPNIARVLDAGASEEGRPYFVMEYVPGMPITDHCDRNRLSIRDRLALFIPVCQAVQHAHQKGVIHRDLKPTNVLVALEDGRPVPKVIDFGIAKATDHRLAQQAVLTRYGVLVGTPEYMSPEQADAGRGEVDTTTDIYSLGVILYELLVGVLPFDAELLGRAAYAEVLRVIREEEPARPSVRVTRLGEVGGEVARSHNTDVPSLRRQLRGDLDSIVLKALEKDRARRYPSASELAADIAHHLAHEPVTASPPGVFYRLGKLVRKNRVAAAAAALVLVALTSGLVVSTAMYRRAANSSREADRQRDFADEQSYVANISAAELLLRDHQTTEAKKRLAAAPAALRGWEWNYLYKTADGSEATIASGEGAVNSVGFTPDGSRILWLTERGVLRAADAATFAPVDGLSYPGPQAPGESLVAVAGDGSMYVSTPWELPVSSVRFGRDRLSAPDFLVARPDGESVQRRTLTLKEATSGSVVASLVHPSIGRSPPLELRGPMDGSGSSNHVVFDSYSRTRYTMSGQVGSVVSAAFSADRRLVATWTWDNVLRVWEVRTGRVVAALSGHRDGISQVAFSPDGSRIASASHDGTVRVWRIDTTEAPRTLAGHAGGVRAVAWSSGGRWLAAGGADHVIHLWRDTGQRGATLTGHNGAVTALAFSSDDRTIVSASADRTIRCWDLATRQQVAVLAGHGEEVRAVGLSGDGRRIASGSSDGTVRVWKAQPVRPLPWPDGDGPGRVKGVAIDAGIDRMTTVSTDGTLHVWKPGQLEPVATFPGVSRGDAAVAMSADGRKVAVACDRVIRVWNLENRETTLLRGHSAPVEAVAMSADGLRVASASGDETVRIWEVASARPMHVLAEMARVHLLAFSPDGQLLAGAKDESMLVWDIQAGSTRFETGEHKEWIRSFAFSPDSRRIASASSSLSIWDAWSGRLFGVLRGQNKTATSVTFNPAGTRLVSGYDDGTIQVWNAASYQPLLTFAPAKRALRCLRFSSDGARILAVTDELAFMLDSRTPYSMGSDLFHRRLPLAAQHRYRMAVAIRPLLFWISRDGVGSASLSWRKGADGARLYEMVLGTDPDVAPWRLNKWGYLAEEISAGGSSAVMLMPDGAWVSKGGAEVAVVLDANSNGTFRYIAIRSEATGGFGRSALIQLRASRDPSYRDVEALLARLPDASPLHQREYAIPKGAKPGFLPTLDDLIHDFASSHVKTRSPWTEAGNRPRRYVYDGRLFELSVAESRHLGPVRFGDRSFPDVIRGEFVITNMGGERTRLQIDFPASGPLQGIPVHVSFRPRWWLSIDLVLDDEPPRPS